MLPEKTNYVTNGVDGLKRLAQGPELSSYRGLSIIHSRKFSMDTGTTPRDLLRRRVRVAEYYRIPWNPKNPSQTYEFYDQSRDTMFRLTWQQLCAMAKLPPGGSGNDDDDYGGHANDFWQIMGGSEPPKEFDVNQWDGKKDPSTVRLKVRHNKKNNEVEYTGLENLLFAMGLANSSFDDNTGLQWPRSIINTHGDRRKRRKLNDLAEKIGDSAGVKSTKFIMSKLSETNRDHHRQSETFGGGIFNDPVIDAEKANWKLLTLFNDAALMPLVNNVGLVFEEFLNMRESVAQVEKQLATGMIHPVNAEEADRFESQLQYLILKSENKLDAEAVKNFIDQRALATLNPQNKTRYEEVLKVKGVEIEQPYGTNAYQTRAREALLSYLKILMTWRAQCFKEAADFMIQNGKTNLSTGGNNAGHTHFNKLKKALWTECVFNALLPDKDETSSNRTARSSQFVAEMGIKPTRSTEWLAKFGINFQAGSTTSGSTTMENIGPAVMEKWSNEFKANTELACMITNVLCRLSGHLGHEMILQPNMHISRCTPLNDQAYQNSASSLAETTWILQQMGCMMPLTGDMAQTLLTLHPDDLEEPVFQAYVQFLNGDIKTANSNLWNTFIMHWFMSEFHPSQAIRDIACKKSGNMRTTESHRVQDFMQAIGHSIRDNKSHTEAVQKTCADLLPDEYIGSNHMPCCIATAAQHYECISKWAENDHLPVHNLKWGDVPVQATPDVLYIDPNFHTGVADIDNQNSSAQKLMQHSASRYGFMAATDLYTAVAGESIVDQTNLKYFNNKKEIKVNSDSHQVQSAHPWTNLIPGGIESISSLSYPIDLQYRASEMNPQNAGQPLYDANNHHLCHVAESTRHFCQDHPHEAMRYILLIWFKRFFKDPKRSMNNGCGIPTKIGMDHYALGGCHLKSGPYLPDITEVGSGVDGAQDIVILRPNIEHEMLGIVMGRGGTQELGATFWGQTELSCYDDAQHGKYQ